MDIKERLRYEVIHNHKILVADYSNLSGAEIAELLSETKTALKQYPKKTIHLLDLVHHVKIDESSIEILRAFAKAIAPYAITWYAVGGLPKVLNKDLSYKDFEVEPFDTKEQAIKQLDRKFSFK